MSAVNVVSQKLFMCRDMGFYLAWGLPRSLVWLAGKAQGSSEFWGSKHSTSIPSFLMRPGACPASTYVNALFLQPWRCLLLPRWKQSGQKRSQEGCGRHSLVVQSEHAYSPVSTKQA